MKKGLFITLEGGEGSGKTTLVQRLSEHLSNNGWNTLVTREPGGCQQAEDIRALLLKGETNRWTKESEVLLFTVARREHLSNVILPALEQGITVICDRFVDSTIVYQGIGNGTSEETILGLHGIFCDNVMPDLTIILDVEPEIGVARSIARAKENGTDETRFENMDITFHARVNNAYLGLAKEQETSRAFVVIDTNTNTPDEVFAAALEICLNLVKFDEQPEEQTC